MVATATGPVLGLSSVGDVCLWTRDHSGLHRPASPALLFFSKIFCDHMRKKVWHIFTLKVYDQLEFPVHVFLLVEGRNSEIPKKAERWAGRGGKETQAVDDTKTGKGSSTSSY